jgi:hypothetical protein
MDDGRDSGRRNRHADKNQRFGHEIKGDVMRVIARAVIYIGFMAAAVVVLMGPLVEMLDTGVYDARIITRHAIAGFALVFVGTELTEWLKRRWP